MFIKQSLKVIGIYLFYVISHYLSSHLYTYFCVPNTDMELVQSAFMTTTPHCQGLRWIIYNGGNTLSAMWVIFGAWLIAKGSNYFLKDD